MNIVEVQSAVIMITYLAGLAGFLFWIWNKARWPYECVIREVVGSGELGVKDRARIVRIKKEQKEWLEWRFKKNKNVTSIIPSGEFVVPLQALFKPKFVDFIKTPNGRVLPLKAEMNKELLLTFDQYSVEALKSTMAGTYDVIEKTYPDPSKRALVMGMISLGAVVISIVFASMIILTAMKNPGTVVQVAQHVNASVAGGAGGLIGGVL